MDEIKEMEEAIETLSGAVEDLGEAVGRLLWDLYYAEQQGPMFLNYVINDWLSMKFSRDIMAATWDIYDHPENADETAWPPFDPAVYE